MIDKKTNTIDGKRVEFGNSEQFNKLKEYEKRTSALIENDADEGCECDCGNCRRSCERVEDASVECPHCHIEESTVEKLTHIDNNKDSWCRNCEKLIIIE